MTLETAEMLMMDMTSVGRTGILSTKGASDALFRPALTYVLVQFNPLLRFLSDNGRRIAFRDDVCPVPREEDLTALIAASRAAACHITSERNYAAGDPFISTIFIGRSENSWSAAGQVGNPYADDVAIWWGEIRLYLGRNLLRAVGEAREHLAEMRRSAPENA